MASSGATYGFVSIGGQGSWNSRAFDCSDQKAKQRQNAASDQRTREHLTVLPALIRIADRQLR
ncbi:hypothetical protein ACH4PU_32605 [Streptomyces sp. NPDC021100]|uniref:hypothetical protein n=1 Tax=Streptomyces sp. NPDC021100 TaxID=3365114 RepID=UPI003796FBE3